MSAKALFTPGGDYFTPVDDRIAELPKGKRHAADLVWKAIVVALPKNGKTERWITDRMLCQITWLLGYSTRFAQKGLNALEGLGLIERKRRRGRRCIIVVARLQASRSTSKPKPGVEGKVSLPIPNVGVVPDANPDQLAAAAAATQKANGRPPMRRGSAR